MRPRSPALPHVLNTVVLKPLSETICDLADARPLVRVVVDGVLVIVEPQIDLEEHLITIGLQEVLSETQHAIGRGRPTPTASCNDASLLRRESFERRMPRKKLLVTRWEWDSGRRLSEFVCRSTGKDVLGFCLCGKTLKAWEEIAEIEFHVEWGALSLWSAQRIGNNPRGAIGASLQRARLQRNSGRDQRTRNEARQQGEAFQAPRRVHCRVGQPPKPLVVVGAVVVDVDRDGQRLGAAHRCGW